MTGVSCWWTRAIAHISRMMPRSVAPHRQREVEMGTISIIVVVTLLPNSGGG
jgi:hypothetical protein